VQSPFANRTTWALDLSTVVGLVAGEGVPPTGAKHKEFGIKHFSRIAVKADGKEFVIELTEVQSHDKLDDGWLARP